MRTYKLYGWISRFCTSVEIDYKEELNLKGWQHKFNGIITCLQDLINKLIPVLVFFAYGYFGHNVTMAKVMLTSVMLTKSKQRFTQITQIISYKSLLIASMEKLDEFVNSNDYQKGLVLHSRKQISSEFALEVKGNFSWGIHVDIDDKDTSSNDKSQNGRIHVNQKTSIGQHLALKNIHVKIRRGEFVCIIGEVGSGKSSFLHQFIG